MLLGKYQVPAAHSEKIAIKSLSGFISLKIQDLGRCIKLIGGSNV
jgi:hypothetical protein